MLRILKTRLQQGFRTVAYPEGAPSLPDRFRGRPVLDPARCVADCRACEAACPTGAIRAEKTSDVCLPPVSDSSETGGRQTSLVLDLGRCLFCGDCLEACPAEAIRFTTDHRLAVRSREDLLVSTEGPRLAAALDEKARALFGHSFKLRQVSAAGCNACEADVNVLNTVVYDLGRFGIGFVASPRHADGILITGPVSQNMRSALMDTYYAVPAPKLVIAVGACAVSGGPYLGHPEACDGASGLLPVDLFIPGCPPHPVTILDGLLRLLGRLPASRL
jgi:Ni,Fe-hydrogenase III small subunit/NAD-dependent dihydropyrimidine dehydrogenase PreA subunit